MKTILFTKNNSLYNLWSSYKFKHNVSVTSGKAEFLKQLNNKDVILGIDVDAVDNVIDFVKKILQDFQDSKIFVLANQPNFTQGKALISLGVKAYANSHMQEIHFNDAITTIKNGNVWLYPEFIQSMIQEMVFDADGAKSDQNDTYDTLSSREKQITTLIQQGLSNKDISEKLGITQRTVKAHTTSIYAKMGVKDRLSLVLAIQNLNA